MKIMNKKLFSIYAFYSIKKELWNSEDILNFKKNIFLNVFVLKSYNIVLNK